MAEHTHFKLWFDYNSRFPATLSARTIHLRNKSQENHVRRMKLAYQKKEMMGLTDCSNFNMSSFVTPARKDRRCMAPNAKCERQAIHSDLPSTKPNSAVNSTNYLKSNSAGNSKSCAALNMQSRGQAIHSDLYQAKSNSAVNNTDYTKNNSARNAPRCAELIMQSRRQAIHSDLLPAKVNFAFNGPHCLKSNAEKKITEVKNSPKSMSCTTKNKSSCEADKKGNELLFKKSPELTVEKQNDTDGGKNEHKPVVKAKLSKIPVLKSRFKTDKTQKSKHFNGVSSNKAAEESFETTLNYVENKIKDLNINSEADVILSTENDFVGDDYLDPVCENPASYSVENLIEELDWQEAIGKQRYPDIRMSSLPSLMSQCYEDDSCPYLNYNTFCKEEKSDDEIFLTNKWINSILDNADYGKNSNEFLPMNSEVVHELKETQDEKRPAILDDTEIWQDMGFETHSIITLSSDKDLQLEDYRSPDYRNFPDYPNTPYNLRYPRYKCKRYNDTLCSIETKSSNSANRTKILKNRKKSYIATPKRIKNGQKTKTKNKILSKQDVSF